MSPLVVATLILFPAFMAYAAASDLVTMRISNLLSLGLAATFPFSRCSAACRPASPAGISRPAPWS